MRHHQDLSGTGFHGAPDDTEIESGAHHSEIHLVRPRTKSRPLRYSSATGGCALLVCSAANPSVSHRRERLATPGKPHATAIAFTIWALPEDYPCDNRVALQASKLIVEFVANQSSGAGTPRDRRVAEAVAGLGRR